MAIAFDTSSNLASGTGSRSWTHTPVTGSPNGVIVVISGGGVDETTDVTYGGTAMERKQTGASTSGETGSTSVWHLGSGLGSGAKTVAITRSGSSAYIASALTTSGTSNTIYIDGNNYTSNNTSAIPLDMTIPNGMAVFMAGGHYSGENAVGSVTSGADITELQNVDFGNFTAFISRRTNIYTGTGGVYTGFNYVQSSDDAGSAAIAIGEDLNQTLTVTAISSAEALGTPVTSSIATATVTGIASAEAVGTPEASMGAPQTLTVTGIASAGALGTPVVSAVATATVTGIATAEALGTPIASTAISLTVTGIATAGAVGVPVSNTVTTLVPTEIASAQALGTPVGTSTVTLTGVGIATGEAWTTPAMNTTISLTVTGIGTADGTGTPILTPTATATVTGIPTAQVVPSPVVTSAVTLTVSGIGTSQAVGTPTLTPTGILVVAGIASDGAIGTPVLSTVDPPLYESWGIIRM